MADTPLTKEEQEKYAAYGRTDIEKHFGSIGNMPREEFFAYVDYDWLGRDLRKHGELAEDKHTPVAEQARDWLGEAYHADEMTPQDQDHYFQYDRYGKMLLDETVQQREQRNASRQEDKYTTRLASRFQDAIRKGAEQADRERNGNHPEPEQYQARKPTGRE